MKAYVAYYRVSTKGQGDSGLGLDAQRPVIEHFAHDGKIIAEFTDIQSGKSAKNRVELQKAIELCKSSGAVLIVAKADRLSRDVRDALEILDSLGEGQLACCDCPNSDRFTITIIFAVAERERELIRIRTKAALDQAKKRGTVLGRPAGYQHSQDTKAAISKTAMGRGYQWPQMVITLVRQERDSGLSLQKIAEKMNALEVKAPRGGKLNASHIVKILKKSEVTVETGPLLG